METYYSRNKNKVIKYIMDNKERIRIRSKQYYFDNKEKYKKYAEDNKERISRYRKSNKQKTSLRMKKYYIDNKPKLISQRNIYNRNRKKYDVNYKLTCSLRTRLYCAIRNKQKLGSAVKDLGCSIEQLKLHLESKFGSGMTWDNWNYNGWHIDHIIPLSSFDLTNREQFLKACHYTNLQPLWSNDNISKGDKIGGHAENRTPVSNTFND